MAGRRVTAILACGVWVALLPALAHGFELRTDLPVLGQVREGQFGDGIEAPIELFGDLGVSDMRHGVTLDTYFRLQEDFAQWTGETDFYSGVLRVPNAVDGLDVQLGRQIISQAPGTIFDADAGQIGITPWQSLTFTAFGGQPRYFEPTYGAPSLSQDEQIFGGNVRATPLQGGALVLGYLQQQRDGRPLRQLVSATGAHSLTEWPGLPHLYGTFSFDADGQNIDQVSAGTQAFIWQPRLLFNFDTGYYKPQNNGKLVVTDINWREDAAFQLFSVSQMLQFRSGLRYHVSRTVSAFADLSYQRYEQIATSYVNGYVWGAGLLCLPGADGLEVVNLQYYGADSAGGDVNGVRASYENRVYDRIVFRALVDVAYYEKATNQDNSAVASIIGLGYIILPGLIGELNFEANRNQLFSEDFRFGFFITYNVRYRSQPPPEAGLRRSWTADDKRPWPWGLAEFGPASWSPNPQPWIGTTNAAGVQPGGTSE